MRPPGDLLASGRDSDIFHYGANSVLRRARGGRSLADEAKVMEHVRAHGYPVPTIEEISEDGRELVMERIDGRLMFAELSARPWTIRRNGQLLGSLHQQLHAIPAPEGLRASPAGVGHELLHLDLHPLNVILSPSGPMVIDWANAARGKAASDVAVTWALLGGASMPTGRVKAWALGWGRQRLIDALLSNIDSGEVRQALPAAVAWKVADPNMTESERASMHALVSAEMQR